MHAKLWQTTQAEELRGFFRSVAGKDLYIFLHAAGALQLCSRNRADTQLEDRCSDSRGRLEFMTGRAKSQTKWCGQRAPKERAGQ